jgi:sugar phosphate isomerase/epimerase
MARWQPLSVQSYCFRHFKDNRVVAGMVKECGLGGIELCGVHANFGQEETFDEVIGIYRAAGIRIVSMGVQGFANKPEAEEKYFRFAQKAGLKVMSANFPPMDLDAFRTAEKLAERYGINLAIHNHGGKHWLGSAQILQALFARLSPRIGLMLDTAWALDAGENPVRMAEIFAGRLYGLHLKDFTFDRARKPQDTIIGTGNLDLPALHKIAENKGFTGEMILEYEGDVENPIPALRSCVEQYRKEFGHE